MLKPIALTTVALALPIAAAWAGTPIDEQRALNADGRISVNNLAGEIAVQTWDRDLVEITGDLGRDVEALEITGSERNLSIRVRYPSNTRGNIEETLLRLRVPVSAEVSLEGVSADVRVDGLRGPLKASSVSGDVTANVASASVELNSVSGDVHLVAPSTRTQLQTVSGDILARGIAGAVKADTVSGDVDLTGGPFDSISTESVSGDVRLLDMTLSDTADVRAESLSGDIILRVKQTPDAQVSLKTFSGTLRNDFGARSSGEKRKLEVTLGSGKAHINLNTFSGDIHLGKQP